MRFNMHSMNSRATADAEDLLVLISAVQTAPTNTSYHGLTSAVNLLGAFTLKNNNFILYYLRF